MITEKTSGKAIHGVWEKGGAHVKALYARDDRKLMIINSDINITPHFYCIVNSWYNNAAKLSIGRYPVAITERNLSRDRTMHASLALSPGSGEDIVWEINVEGQTSYGEEVFTLINGAIHIEFLTESYYFDQDFVRLAFRLYNSTGIPVTYVIRNNPTPTRVLLINNGETRIL